ncbi:unnamed protein product [Bursaphelenchus xylophilus]|uniref:(pine wood nematode) hypothetical protein n=1 Tax=Bursaphelenchus xylophilus TaxID=6326 RepID=A0A1I7RYG5_BURXY|nr:unnamed protein product [Bursaphelenchus xylophilus]CAG9085752.1 unnamed protein product [Bursaphelenchus xylophilus]
MARLNKIVDELVETEKSFVTDLYRITVGFSDFFISQEKPFIEIRELLSVLNKIRRFNRNLLREFKRADYDYGAIATTFLKNREGFAVYFMYCIHYPRAIDRLLLLKKKPSFMELLMRQQMEADVILPLESYLLKPFQRILKYPLILRKMMDYFYESEQIFWDDFSDLKGAHDLMVNLSSQLNEHKRKLEEKQSSLIRSLPQKLDLPRRWIGCFKISSNLVKIRRTQSAESLCNLTVYDIS